jgi:hypothetical protein
VRRRRLWPFAVFLLVVLLAAGTVWWRVLRADDREQLRAACLSAHPTQPVLTLRAVEIRVYNATDRQGLAAQTSTTLRSDGFTVITIANDPTNRKVTGAGEIRYGPAGARKAALVEAAFPDATPVTDKRTDDTIDVALGPKFTRAAAPTAIEAELARLNLQATPPC